MDKVSPKAGDVSEEEWKINILVFDMQSWGTNVNYVSSPSPSSTASDRYAAMLRHCSHGNDVFISPNMKVQWAGQLHSLRGFRDREKDSMSHVVGCYIRLGLNTPSEIALMHCE